MGGLGAGRGLLERDVGRDRGQGIALGEGQVLGVRTEPVLAVPEYPIADPERRDALADRFDHAGELGAEDRSTSASRAR